MQVTKNQIVAHNFFLIHKLTEWFSITDEAISVQVLTVLVNVSTKLRHIADRC